MAKTSAIEKDRYRRKLVEKYARDRAELRAMARDRKRPPDERFEATLALAKLPRNGAKVRVRNRCAMTGRPRAVYRKFGLSRIALRELASNGQIPGMIKASW